MAQPDDDPSADRRTWRLLEGDEPDPRWSLANERTLLAYSRTALAMIVAGLAIAGSRSVTGAPWWLAAAGLPLVAVGILVATTSRRRYLEVQHAMRNDLPLPHPAVAVLLTWALAGIGALAFVLAALQLAIG
jgi:putative membrane protein